MNKIAEMFCRTALKLCVVSLLASATSAQQPVADENDKYKISAQFLAGIEEQLREDIDSEKRFYLTTKAAPAAFKAGDMKKAKSYSYDLLKQAETWKTNWNYGNAIHVANLVLGRIALANGALEDAKNFLLDAGKTPGSPQLNSFGPNMLLAMELLEKGERKTVIQYFDLCAKFWEPKFSRLDDWKGSINRDEIPEFGPNLRYQL